MGRLKQGFKSVREGLEKNKIFFETLAAISLTLMSLLVSWYATSLTNYQNKLLNYQDTLLHNEALPQFVIEQMPLIDPKTHYAADYQINIYNYGKIVHAFSVFTAVFVRPNNPKIHFKNGRIPLTGYYAVTRLNPSGQQLITEIDGFNNNLLFLKLSNVFFQKTNSYLNLDVYFQLNYIDSLGDKHIDYYQLPFNEGMKIGDAEGFQAINDYLENADPLVLETATYSDLAKQMT